MTVTETELRTGTVGEAMTLSTLDVARAFAAEGDQI